MAYVISGAQAADPGNVDLAALGARGIRIDSAGALTGHAVAAAGDINGDGRDDVTVCAPLAAPGGSAYAVYGEQAADPGNVDLALLGTRGMRIGGTTA